MTQTEKPFSLYLRKNPKGRDVFYYTVKDHRGKRIARSTGCCDRIAAEQYCWQLFYSGEIACMARELSLKKYTEKWFLYDECPYVQPRLRRGVLLSRSHIDTKRSFLVNQIWPHLGSYRLGEIKTYHIDAWLDQLKAEGYSHTSLNHFLKALKQIYNEALRLGDIKENPAAKVLNFSSSTKQKGILSEKEAYRLFYSPQALYLIWGGNHQQYAINLLASCTGMRMGEIMALRMEQIHETYISVDSAWDRKYGLKGTKTKRSREVPIPKHVYEAVIAEGKQQIEGGFIFSSSGGQRPIDHKAITKWLYRALEQIGIDQACRQERNITFHSWRHFFNSGLRKAGIPDSITQSITGHSTLQMTNHYTHIGLEDYGQVRQIQNNFQDSLK